MKRICSRLLALVMVLAAIPVTVLAVSDREPNNNMNQAQKFTLFDTISGSITDKDYDWYKFTLDAPGAVTLKMTSYLPYYSVWCFDAEGNELWSQDGICQGVFLQKITNLQKRHTKLPQLYKR